MSQNESSSISSPMSLQEVIAQFERGLPLEEPFHHREHVQLAFAYLSEFPVLEALQKFANGLRDFAIRRGKPKLYHETITFAYFLLIRERMARREGAGWDDFVKENPDLMIWKDEILKRYYTEATLQSDFARTVFVFPEKA